MRTFDHRTGPPVPPTVQHGRHSDSDCSKDQPFKPVDLFVWGLYAKKNSMHFVLQTYGKMLVWWLSLSLKNILGFEEPSVCLLEGNLLPCYIPEQTHLCGHQMVQMVVGSGFIQVCCILPDNSQLCFWSFQKYTNIPVQLSLNNMFKGRVLDFDLFCFFILLTNPWMKLHWYSLILWNSYPQ